MNIAICVKPLSDELLTGIGYTSLYYINSLVEIDKSNTYYIFSNREIKNLDKIDRRLKFFNYNTKSFLLNKIEYFNKKIKYKKMKNRSFLFLSIRRFVYKALNEIFHYKKIRAELKRNNIDLILFMDIAGVIQFYPKKIKKIVIVYDLVWKRFPETMDFTHSIRMKVLANNFYGKCDQVIAISNSTKNDFINFLKLKTPVEVIHLGIDRKRFIKQTSKEVNRVLEKYNISKKYILTVGTLEPRKNLINVVEAFSKLKNKNMYQLVMIGNRGWGDVDLSEIVKKYNVQSETIMTGYVEGDELNAFYSGAEVFVYPSLYEGFGLPILEAMSCGCPVITSNNSSMPEVANDAAILIEALNVMDLKDAIEKVLNNSVDRLDMKKRGFSNINNFSWEKTASHAVSVIEKTFLNKQ